MNATHAFRANCCCTYRWLARTSAAILFVTWLAAVAFEGRPPHGVTMPLGVQLGILAAVFGGYAISIRHEVLGAIVSLVGVVAFAVSCVVLMSVAPTFGFAWFALPPVLFLVAWELARKEKRASAPTEELQ